MSRSLDDPPVDHEIDQPTSNNIEKIQGLVIDLVCNRLWIMSGLLPQDITFSCSRVTPVDVLVLDDKWPVRQENGDPLILFFLAVNWKKKIETAKKRESNG